MRAINPYFSAVRRADKLIGDSLRATARKQKRHKEAAEYLTGTHLYKLLGNSRDLGETMTMTGAQAKAQNDVLLEIYREDIRQEIESGVKFGATQSVLKRWVVVERHVDAGANAAVGSPPCAFHS
ncbi:MAG: hypothetical protein HS117_19270 [Verrucomicrobiaceae bacterium]|nr:hypothetical protein [Verrucomicrobiaceae bacterium]